MRRRGWYKYAKSSPDFLIESCDAFAQFVASRQHDPAALDVKVFRFIDLIGGGRSLRPALPRTFVASRNLS